MSMKLVCFGEAIIDMLQSSFDDDCGYPSYIQFPGGAPANVAVAAAKLGANSYFCGMLGEDRFGKFLFQQMLQERVKLDFVNFTSEAKTALAFVSLDETGERSFEFYRPPAADLCFGEEHIRSEMWEGNGIFHFCSNSFTQQDIANTSLTMVQQAKAASWLVSMDVNLRHNLWPNTAADTKLVSQACERADIVKFSREELEYLAENSQTEQFDTEDYVRNLIVQGVKLVIVTDGAEPLLWRTQNSNGQIIPPKVDVKDTTAAGDAFVGGLLAQITKHKLQAEELSQWLMSPELETVLYKACQCGGFAASRQGAFPSLPNETDFCKFTI